MLLLDLYKKVELRPFIPVVAEFQSRLAGIEDECESLGLSFKKEVQSEQEMFFALISQKALAFDVTNEMGEVWDIRLEPFSHFKSRSKKSLSPSWAVMSRSNKRLVSGLLLCVIGKDLFYTQVQSISRGCSYGFI